MNFILIMLKCNYAYKGKIYHCVLLFKYVLYILLSNISSFYNTNTFIEIINQFIVMPTTEFEQYKMVCAIKSLSTKAICNFDNILL